MNRLFAGTPFDIPPKCDHCDKLLDQCDCTEQELQSLKLAEQRRNALRSPESQTARIRLEKRKANRQVTVVAGLVNGETDLNQLLGRLQSKCGCGGVLRPEDEVVELQGDHVERVRSALKGWGYRVR